MSGDKFKERAGRAKKIVSYLKRAYPVPKSELKHNTNFQFVAAVILSAQCTDKAVNKLTDSLFEKYAEAKDFASADLATFTKEISTISFFRNKAKARIGAAKIINDTYGGAVPKTEAELVELPGVGY